MARETFLSDPSDVEWLFDTHLKSRLYRHLRHKVHSFVLFGNEDAPDRLHLYTSREPSVTDRYDVIVLSKEGRTMGGKTPHRRNPAKHLGGYPDSSGRLTDFRGKPTPWRITESVKTYRLPDSSFSTSAEAVILRHDSRRNIVAVGLSYGKGMILRASVLAEAPYNELKGEAIAEAEYWLTKDREDDERDAGEPDSNPRRHSTVGRTMSIAAFYIGDGYLAGVSDDPFVPESHWPLDWREGEEGEDWKVEQHVVPVRAFDKFAKKMEDNAFSDGYEAASELAKIIE